ncbi:MAG TPA: Na+/H+ antiporter NhaA [Acidimicrobiia bacterium]
MTGRRTHIRVPVAGRYVTPLGQEFASVEALGGIVLLLAAVVALVWANSPWSDSYSSFWGHDVTATLGRFSVADDLRHWVNDGLMALFFFVVGLEVKRELTEGELTDRRAATLPVFAAVGGMVAPALVYFAWNPSGPSSSGWGIPMATDTAFALGVLALLGARVAPGLKLFLLTLAVVDDIGAISVIAIFYSSDVQAEWLAGAALTILFIMLLRRLGIALRFAYVVPALVLWLCVFQSGIHATIAGVVLGLLTPVADARGRRVIDALEHTLHPWATLGVVPVFVLANAGVALGSDAVRSAASSSISWGVATGLVAGKPLGVVGATAACTWLGLSRLPDGTSFRQLLGVAALAGIGFTVSLFIADRSFAGARLAEAKLGILAGSLAAGLVGTALLARRVRRTMPAGGR